MKNFINRPIPRLLRYELLLKNILDETPEGHEDRDYIPQVLDVIKALGKETEPGVVSAKQKVEVWRYNSNLVFKSGEYIVSDLVCNFCLDSILMMSLPGHGLVEREPLVDSYGQAPPPAGYRFRMEWLDGAVRAFVR